uniref:NYN domain-containing protein n=1 Tax=Desertifilum tharense IPPAS B-1220 TaxID=1781255 RepID=A0ACD5H1J0_9CYAN
MQNSLPLEPDIQANVLPLIEYLLKLQPSEGIETTVRQVLQALHYLKSLDTHSCSNHSSPPEPQGLSLLLLDAENIKFDPHLETFLAQLSSYPLNVKIAFANWKNTAGDSELYERGYQMIHVPLGKNSADAQMLAMGSAIRLHYPQVKEAFICSSDWLLNHLCNELQNQGLTVYRVRREDDNFRIENRQTGEIRYYSTTYNVEVPTPLDLMQSIEQLIQAEHQSLTERLVQLSTVMNLVQQRAAIEKQEKARISPSLDGLSSADKPIESQPLPEPRPKILFIQRLKRVQN